MSYVIGIDLGGTHMRAALIDEHGAIHRHTRIRTEPDDGPNAVIGRMVALLKEMERGTEGPILGVGVGAPGPLDPNTGIVLTAPNLPGWDNLPLQSLLQQHTTLPVQIGNDANLAALAEWSFGAGKGLHNLIYVTISTGIGGGIIAQGRLLLGRKGLAAEVGHMTMRASGGPVCGCGNVGCWETLASGTALARTALEALAADAEPSLLRDIPAGQLTAAHVTEAAQQNDGLACRLLEQEGTLIGMGIINLLHLFSPEMIVLGGGVTNGGELIFKPMRSIIAERAMPSYRDVPVVQTALGDQIGVLGAAALVYYTQTV